MKILCCTLAVGTLLTAGAVSAAGPHNGGIVRFIQLEELEYRTLDDSDAVEWEGQGWIGGDRDKFWVKFRGEQTLSGRDGLEQAEFQALYSRAISTFYDAQLGVRYDLAPDPERAFAVLALHGLAPYFFETDLSLFASNEGELSLRAEARYDLLLTQRLILQPQIELNLASDDAPRRGIGSGFNDLELGLRLRYEISRKFAPYVGVSWERSFGETASLARREGEDPDTFNFVAGLRLWY